MYYKSPGNACELLFRILPSILSPSSERRHRDTKSILPLDIRSCSFDHTTPFPTGLITLSQLLIKAHMHTPITITNAFPTSVRSCVSIGPQAPKVLDKEMNLCWNRWEDVCSMAGIMFWDWVATLSMGKWGASRIWGEKCEWREQKIDLGSIEGISRWLRGLGWKYGMLLELEDSSLPSFSFGGMKSVGLAIVSFDEMMDTVSARVRNQRNAKWQARTSLNREPKMDFKFDLHQDQLRAATLYLVPWKWDWVWASSIGTNSWPANPQEHPVQATSQHVLDTNSEDVLLLSAWMKYQTMIFIVIICT